MDDPNQEPCACGKKQYFSKKQAKRARRRLHPGDSRIGPYKCGPYWHLGHLPKAVVSGKKTRSDIVSPKRPPR